MWLRALICATAGIALAAEDFELGAKKAWNDYSKLDDDSIEMLALEHSAMKFHKRFLEGFAKRERERERRTRPRRRAAPIHIV